MGVDSDKFFAITAWLQPTNVRKLRGFLGLVGYYRHFVCHYPKIAAPLYVALLCKDKFDWLEEATKSFIQLKSILTTTLVLHLPNFKVVFVLETDVESRLL